MSGADTKKKLVGRHKRVAFMDVAGDGKTYTRMTGFTSMSESKNASAGHDGGYQAAQRPAPASAIMWTKKVREQMLWDMPHQTIMNLTAIPMIRYSRKLQKSQMMNYLALMHR